MSSKEQGESAPSTTELARKVVRLEKLVGKVLAEDELIGMYMSRLLDVLARFWPADAQYRSEVKTKLDIFLGALEKLEKEWQEHYKHHSHTDKKTKPIAKGIIEL